MILCRVLGPVEILVGDAPAPAELLWRKHLALLLYLARSPKRARTREHLSGLLWPDKKERAARHSLNEALRVLRRSVGDDGVTTTAGQVRLSAESVRLDADDLERLIGAGGWHDATELITGEFLEGFAVPGCDGFEDWLGQERRHWTGRSIVALLGASTELLRQGRAAEALAFARRSTTLDPLSNAAACGVMAALAAEGDAAGALAFAERFENVLRQELGTGLAEETRQLADRIRKGGLRARQAERQPVAAEHRRAPLVGRSEELRRLLDLWDRCRAGQGATAVVIEGESGTGKTRLLDEFLNRVVLSGGAVALVRAVEGDRADIESGLLGLARGGLLGAPGVPAAPAEALAALASAIPEWGDRFGGAALPAAVPLPRALGSVLAAILNESPLLLIIDDAQWLDRTSLLALLALLRDLARTPLYLALATLPHPPREEIDELRRRLGQDVPGTAITLAPLGSHALRQLAAWALPAYDAVELERVCRRVASDSAGIPFLAVELLSAVAHGFDLRQGTSAWPEPSHTLTQSLPTELPDNVVAALRIGFRRLTDDARQVLGAAALIGDRVTDALLARATELPLPRVHAALDELEWQRWLEADGRGYGFVASLARKIVGRDMLTPGQKARLHQRAGLSPSDPPPRA